MTLVLLAIFIPVYLQIFWLLLIFLANFKRPSKRKSYGSPKTNFLILIPAHNESAGIVSCIESVKSLNYPKSIHKIVVIADNCSDDTAMKVRNQEVDVWERFSDDRKSKGFALEDAFIKYLNESDADAFVVIDADTEVDAQLLKEFDEDLALGYNWIQAYYAGSNAYASWRTKLMEWGFAVFNGTYLQGLESLGLSVPLRGNGMCFSRSGLRKVPWSCSGLAEDMEFGWELRFQNERVHYNHNAKVYGEFVSKRSNASSQRKRWEEGRNTVRTSFKKRLKELSLVKRFFFGFDLRMWPMAKLIASILVITLVFSVTDRDLLIVPLTLFSIVMLYVLSPFIFLQASPRLLLSSGYIPWYIVWKGLVKLRKGAGAWVRTTRESEK